jgi:hypothetical protein
MNEEIKREIERWVKNHYPAKIANDVKSAIFQIIREKKLEWNNPAHLEIIVNELNPWFGQSEVEKESLNSKEIHFNDQFIGHQGGANLITDSFTINNLDSRIQNSFFPMEVKEILMEQNNKAYKSIILANLDELGRIKLIRKAKILYFLYSQ